MSKEIGSEAADFSILYKWSEGTVPPPYYYEFTIRLGPGKQGSIEFLPDYPMHDPPMWTETFDLDEGDLNRLHALMAEKGVFTAGWTEVADPPVGGSLEWMEVTVGEERFLVPSTIEEKETVRDVYRTINSLVPERIRDKLMAQREEFERTYLENESHNRDGE